MFYSQDYPKSQTVPHEFLYCLGLQHTFYSSCYVPKEDTFGNKAPYDDEIAYQIMRTDNYMDYGNTKQFLYAWQCKKINPNL